MEGLVKSSYPLDHLGGRLYTEHGYDDNNHNAYDEIEEDTNESTHWCC